MRTSRLSRSPRRPSRSVATAPLAGSLAAGQRTLSAQDDRRREVALRVTDAGFEPARIDARLNDIVAITLTAGDTPHGLSLDEYRSPSGSSPASPCASSSAPTPPAPSGSTAP